MTAIGYIRQSRRADLDVALSRYSQLAAIQRMATADGVDVQIDDRLGRALGDDGVSALAAVIVVVMAVFGHPAIVTLGALEWRGPGGRWCRPRRARTAGCAQGAEQFCKQTRSTDSLKSNAVSPLPLAHFERVNGVVP